MTSAPSRPTPKGLKRLSLTPGTTILNGTLTPSTESTWSAPPLSNNAPARPSLSRNGSKRVSSSISYTNSSPVNQQSYNNGPLSAPLVEPASNISRQNSPRPPLSRHSSSSPRPDILRRESTPTVDETRPLPAVLTPVEKHADLLHFIAQKEAKCLELRTQLEQHEAELATLKQKWEKIVSKTNGRPASTPSVPPLILSTIGGGSYIANGRDAAVVEVVGAIKDSVQGISRILGMGIDDGPSTTSSTTRAELFSEQDSQPNTKARTSPLMPSSSLDAVSASSSSIQNNKSCTPQARNPHTRHISRSTASTSSISSIPGLSPTSSITTSTSSRFLDDEMTPTTESPGLRHSPPLRTEFDPDWAFRNVGDVASPSPNRTSQDQDLSTGPGLPSAWVPRSINKKWEQIQRTETFTKSSKRASLLLSDVTSVSNTLLGTLSSALSPPILDSPSPKPLAPTKHESLQSRSARRNPLSAPPTADLLDFQDGDSSFAGLDAPMVPSPASASPISRNVTLTNSNSNAAVNSQQDDDDDLWNW